MITCGNSPATRGSGNYKYQWESSTDKITWTPISGATAQQYTLNTAMTQTTYYRRKVTDNICANTAISDTIEIIILPPPTVLSGSNELCLGISAFLSPSTGGTWTSDYPAVAEIINNITVKGVSPGMATLTFVNDTSGCSNKITLTVRDFPTLNTEILGDEAVCIGNTITLSNAIPNGVWSTANYDPKVTIADPNANPVSITGTKQGTTYVTYTVSNGVCQAKKTFKVKVLSNTPPKVIIGIERK
jgi:hypothetical protein